MTDLPKESRFDLAAATFVTLVAIAALVLTGGLIVSAGLTSLASLVTPATTVTLTQQQEEYMTRLLIAEQALSEVLRDHECDTAPGHLLRSECRTESFNTAWGRETGKALCGRAKVLTDTLNVIKKMQNTQYPRRMCPACRGSGQVQLSGVAYPCPACAGTSSQIPLE